MALEQMEGFELAGRTVSTMFTCLQHVLNLVWSSCGSTRFTRREQRNMHNKTLSMKLVVWITCVSVDLLLAKSSLTGGNLNAASRQALMQKLARTDQPTTRPQPM